MGVSAAIFYAIVIACPIIYGIRQLVLFIIKQVKAHKAWKMEYEEYEETHEEELYWRVKRKLDEPAERRKREMDNTCLLYTSDAADEEDSVDVGGSRSIRKKKKKKKEG